jgi:hypothetical protein
MLPLVRDFPAQEIRRLRLKEYSELVWTPAPVASTMFKRNLA